MFTISQDRLAKRAKLDKVWDNSNSVLQKDLIDIKNDIILSSVLNQTVLNNVCLFVPECPIPSKIGLIFSMDVEEDPLMRLITRHANLVEAKYWCIAGGFVCNLLGKTTAHNDIDVFFLQCKTNCDEFSHYERINRNIIVNVINMPNIDTLPDCPHICVYTVLCGFDLPISMNALYRVDSKWVLMSLTDDGRPRIHRNADKLCTSIRVKKYEQRSSIIKQFNPPPLQELVGRAIMETYRFPMLNCLKAYNLK